MNIVNVIKVPVILVAVLIGISGCGKEDSADDAGKTAGETIEKAVDSVKAESREFGLYVNDAELTAKANALLLSEPMTKVFEINVDTIKGVTTLQGTVDSSESKEKAGMLVASIDGVKHVNNELVIESTK